jgi:hypothetical protein
MDVLSPPSSKTTLRLQILSNILNKGYQLKKSSPNFFVRKLNYVEDKRDYTVWEGAPNFSYAQTSLDLHREYCCRHEQLFEAIDLLFGSLRLKSDSKIREILEKWKREHSALAKHEDTLLAMRSYNGARNDGSWIAIKPIPIPSRLKSVTDLSREAAEAEENRGIVKRWIYHYEELSWILRNIYDRFLSEDMEAEVEKRPGMPMTHEEFYTIKDKTLFVSQQQNIWCSIYPMTSKRKDQQWWTIRQGRVISTLRNPYKPTNRDSTICLYGIKQKTFDDIYEPKTDPVPSMSANTDDMLAFSAKLGELTVVQPLELRQVVLLWDAGGHPEVEELHDSETRISEKERHENHTRKQQTQGVSYHNDQRPSYASVARQPTFVNQPLTTPQSHNSISNNISHSLSWRPDKTSPLGAAQTSTRPSSAATSIGNPGNKKIEPQAADNRSRPRHELSQNWRQKSLQ